MDLRVIAGGRPLRFGPSVGTGSATVRGWLSGEQRCRRWPERLPTPAGPIGAKALPSSSDYPVPRVTSPDPARSPTRRAERDTRSSRRCSVLGRFAPRSAKVDNVGDTTGQTGRGARGAGTLSVPADRQPNGALMSTMRHGRSKRRTRCAEWRSPGVGCRSRRHEPAHPPTGRVLGQICG